MIPGTDLSLEITYSTLNRRFVISLETPTTSLLTNFFYLFFFFFSYLGKDIIPSKKITNKYKTKRSVFLNLQFFKEYLL